MFIILDTGFFGDTQEFFAAFNTKEEAEAFVSEYGHRYALEICEYEIGTLF